MFRGCVRLVNPAKQRRTHLHAAPDGLDVTSHTISLLIALTGPDAGRPGFTLLRPDPTIVPAATTLKVMATEVVTDAAPVYPRSRARNFMGGR